MGTKKFSDLMSALQAGKPLQPKAEPELIPDAYYEDGEPIPVVFVSEDAPNPS